MTQNVCHAAESEPRHRRRGEYMEPCHRFPCTLSTNVVFWFSFSAEFGTILALRGFLRCFLVPMSSPSKLAKRRFQPNPKTCETIIGTLLLGVMVDALMRERFRRQATDSTRPSSSQNRSPGFLRSPRGFGISFIFPRISSPFCFFAFLGSPLFSTNQAKQFFFAGVLIPA